MRRLRMWLARLILPGDCGIIVMSKEALSITWRRNDDDGPPLREAVDRLLADDGPGPRRIDPAMFASLENWAAERARIVAGLKSDGDAPFNAATPKADGFRP